MSASVTRVLRTWNWIFVPLGVSVLGVACNSSKEDAGTVRSVEPDVPAESVSGDVTSPPEDSSASPSEDDDVQPSADDVNADDDVESEAQGASGDSSTTLEEDPPAQGGAPAAPTETSPAQGGDAGGGTAGMGGATDSKGGTSSGGAGGVQGAAGDADSSRGGASGQQGAGAMGGEWSDGPRNRPLSVLVDVEVAGYRTSSIPSGLAMLSEIAEEYSFSLEEHDETSPQLTIEYLSEYDLVFFLNTSGDFLDNDEEQALEEWLTTRDGAFAATSIAITSEADWDFYRELVGENASLNTTCCPDVEIEWTPEGLSFVALSGFSSPWVVSDVFFELEAFDQWSSEPGFIILGTAEVGGVVQPVSFMREWSGFRSFYTMPGFDSASFEDPDMKRHIAAGILWAMRREEWIQ